MRLGKVLISAVLAAASLPTAAGVLGAEVAPPPGWPTTSGAAPRVDTAPNGLRLAGPDRAQTALAVALALEADGASGPFGTPDVDDDAWGLGRCPFTVIIAAGDVPADALVASTLSDPTTNSTEPLLVRSASADPDFDPIGDASRVDTDVAPILLTTSARHGATALSTAARAAVVDLATKDPEDAGDCGSVRSAIVVGGTGAVASSVDDELIGLGLDEVFRVAGADRYATAVAIADALGTGPAVDARCADADAADATVRAGWYGNAAVEYRDTRSTCRVLGRTVVLADGVDGADALAAGWWTSRWQTPVLLTGPGGTRTAATDDALARLDIDHVVVLGGTGRISDDAAAQVGATASAEVLRVAGADRYETSVRMAERFAGLGGTATTTSSRASAVCLVASSGTGDGAQGWPDALAAGPWCAAAGGTVGQAAARDAAVAPLRSLGPVEGPGPWSTAGLAPSRSLVPVLLTPAGPDAALVPSVVTALRTAYGVEVRWCTARIVTDECTEPGFVVGFGGASTLSARAFEAASQLVGGGIDAGGHEPVLVDAPFLTRLDLEPVHDRLGPFTTVDADRPALCARRGGVADARWLVAEVGTAAAVAVDLVDAGRYRADGDGVARSAGRSAPLCLALGPADDDARIHAQLVGPAGARVPAVDAAPGPGAWTTTPEPLTTLGAVDYAGTDMTRNEDDGGRTDAVFVFDDGPDLLLGGVEGAETAVRVRVERAEATFAVVRGLGSDRPDEFDVAIRLDVVAVDGPRPGVATTIVGSASGEAHEAAGTWRLRGRWLHDADVGLGVRAGVGGFSADWIADATDGTDDRISIRFDAVDVEATGV